MIIIVLFDIDIHIFTVIKVLFNLVVRFKYILLNKYFYILYPKVKYFLHDEYYKISPRLLRLKQILKVFRKLNKKYTYLYIQREKKNVSAQTKAAPKILCKWSE